MLISKDAHLTLTMAALFYPLETAECGYVRQSLKYEKGKDGTPPPDSKRWDTAFALLNASAFFGLENGTATHGRHVVNRTYCHTAIRDGVNYLTISNIDGNVSRRLSQASVEHKVAVF